MTDSIIWATWHKRCFLTCFSGTRWALFQLESLEMTNTHIWPPSCFYTARMSDLYSVKIWRSKHEPVTTVWVDKVMIYCKSHFIRVIHFICVPKVPTQLTDGKLKSFFCTKYYIAPTTVTIPHKIHYSGLYIAHIISAKQGTVHRTIKLQTNMRVSSSGKDWNTNSENGLAMETFIVKSCFITSQ